MTNATILHMRVEWFAEHYPGEKFHALLCDPPYEYGFMGKSWDNTGIAFSSDVWAGLAEHLHPGGFGMAFSSSRTWHRLAVAIEDAGLIIHPSIFGWATGSGFPKATRIDTQVDADAGGQARYTAQTERARAWEGHRYGLQALKPALEPIIVFQKPYANRPVDDITSTGAGALNIDGARIPVPGDDPNKRRETGDLAGTSEQMVYGNGLYNHTRGATLTQGRWPANLLLLDDGAAAALDAQSGAVGGAWSASHGDVDESKVSMFGNRGGRSQKYTDSGGASRFFYHVRHALDAADPVCYTAKASRSEREAGLEGMGRKPSLIYSEKAQGPLPQQTPSKPSPRRNHHPTVKPLDLARYLATLLLPPDEYAPRRLLVPFAGSGSECIGAWMAGWEEVVGVEFKREYASIARARLAHWMAQGVQLDFMEDLTA